MSLQHPFSLNISKHKSSEYARITMQGSVPMHKYVYLCLCTHLAGLPTWGIMSSTKSGLNQNEITQALRTSWLKPPIKVGALTSVVE